ncbi:expression library immunization antigen 1 [Hirsutella rhossiliensis]|uniref:Expression library immunization antigen 1 n=1 Tax=Hirsutella rhossiliensis TaxID=111463 RepID=A0A9P8MW13_9HYPO|nr:expression library immunization antigen 1 [Hirsutella rhossiliensis]KAH0962280.1 expression library immunization antigen 1 [Hirsutella rhossiliensis]
MLSTVVTVVGTALAAAHGAFAHFALTYPEWRADTLAEDADSEYSQWTYPCAGVDYGAGNVTDWPLDGGSLKLELHHPWTYVFVNLGVGQNTTNFNVSLTPEFWNTTGKGTLCIEKVPVPIDVENGTLATLQVVTTSASGSALYNCADIRFNRNAKSLSNCSSSGVEYAPVRDQKKSNGTNSSGGNSTGGGNGQGGDRNGAGPAMAVTSTIGLVAVAAIASLFAIDAAF